MIDLNTQSLVASVKGFQQIFDIALTWDGQLLVVADAGSQSFKVVDTLTNQIIAEIRVPAKYPLATLPIIITPLARTSP